MSTRQAEENAPRLSLPLEIHTATRNQHIALNRHITSRLQLCLPPYANSPYLYTLGISAFVQIYEAFEENLEAFLSGNRGSNKLRTLLSQLLINGLERRASLHDDLRILKDRGEFALLPHEFLSHWHQRVTDRLILQPHRILAYQWVMYMALFNGGRWIRDQLIAAGPGFWKGSHASEVDRDGKIDCISFWHFPGEDDGEDIKDDFKARFNEVAFQLSDRQHLDIVEEAVHVFDLCRNVVEWLDHTVSSDPRATMPPVVSSRHLGERSWLMIRFVAIFAIIAIVWQRLLASLKFWWKPSYSMSVKQESNSD